MLHPWLLSRLPTSRSDRHDSVLNVAQRLRIGHTPRAIAAELGWTDRQWHWVCRTRFGATAANLHRLHRLELVRGRLVSTPVALAQLAGEPSYSDQAHMVRDFRHFAQTTMTAFIQEQVSVGNLQDAGSWLPVLRELRKTDPGPFFAGTSRWKPGRCI